MANQQSIATALKITSAAQRAIKRQKNRKTHNYRRKIGKKEKQIKGEKGTKKRAKERNSNGMQTAIRLSGSN